MDTQRGLGILAVGSSGMAETAENAGQAVLTAYWNGGLGAENRFQGDSHMGDRPFKEMLI